MDKISILVVGRNEEILKTVIRLISGHADWEGIGAVTDEDAIEKFHQHPSDIVLLTNGISDEEDRKLRKIFTHQRPDVIIIQHYGGGSGLLSNEIREALDKRKAENKPTYSFTDDIFKTKK